MLSSSALDLTNLANSNASISSKPKYFLLALIAVLRKKDVCTPGISIGY